MRERILGTLNAWLAEEGMPPVKPLSGEDLMHAVSRGAAYYGLARHGSGVRIRGGVPRTYYVGIESAMPAVPGFPAPLKALTVVPFGMEEGTDVRIPGREFGLVVGQPAEFRFFTSAARKNDQPGDLIEDFGDELEELSPMEVSFHAGEKPSEVVPVSFETVVTETGMLQLWCVARDGRRWKLEFNVRERVHGMKIGIDLGTTNSALAYIDEREAEDRDFPPIHIFETPQLVAPGRVEPRRTLPSFLFLEDGQPVGVYAREQGALVPTRLVHSAKSWLSNPDVDRTAKILPWDSQETGRVLSPVEVSARFIAKFREEWDKAQGRAAGRAGHRPHRARFVRRRGARADRDGGARCRARASSRCSKSRPRRSIPGSPTTWRNRARSCSTARSCWSATWAAAPAISA